MIASATLLMIASGIIHGTSTDRWGESAKLSAAAVRLDTIPARLGDWKSQELQKSDEELQIAGAEGYVFRRYVNVADGNVVVLMMLCGPPGPISVHPPTVCFTGSGWQLTSDPERFRLDRPSSDLNDEFLTARFTSGQAVTVANSIRVFWSWNAAGTWQVPKNPRVTFAKYPYLYKLYVTAEAGNTRQPPSESPGASFLRLLLPRIRADLFP